MAKYTPQIGDVVSDQFYRVLYTVVKINKTTVWCLVRLSETIAGIDENGYEYSFEQRTYKNVRPSVLRLVSRKETNDPEA